eukprot:163320-Chlamydomonas_euryale.AAC.1
MSFSATARRRRPPCPPRRRAPPAARCSGRACAAPAPAAVPAPAAPRSPRLGHGQGLGEREDQLHAVAQRRGVHPAGQPHARGHVGPGEQRRQRQHAARALGRRAGGVALYGACLAVQVRLHAERVARDQRRVAALGGAGGESRGRARGRSRVGAGLLDVQAVLGRHEQVDAVAEHVHHGPGVHVALQPLGALVPQRAAHERRDAVAVRELRELDPAAVGRVARDLVADDGRARLAHAHLGERVAIAADGREAVVVVAREVDDAAVAAAHDDTRVAVDERAARLLRHAQADDVVAGLDARALGHKAVGRELVVARGLELLHRELVQPARVLLLAGRVVLLVLLAHRAVVCRHKHAALHGILVRDQAVLLVEAREARDRDDHVGATRQRVAVDEPGGLRAHERPLGRVQHVRARVEPPPEVGHRQPDRLLAHRALVRVARRLVVVGERDAARDDAQHRDRRQLGVRVAGGAAAGAQARAADADQRVVALLHVEVLDRARAHELLPRRLAREHARAQPRHAVERERARGAVYHQKRPHEAAADGQHGDARAQGVEHDAGVRMQHARALERHERRVQRVGRRVRADDPPVEEHARRGRVLAAPEQRVDARHAVLREQRQYELRRRRDGDARGQRELAPVHELADRLLDRRGHAPQVRDRRHARHGVEVLRDAHAHAAGLGAPVARHEAVPQARLDHAALEQLVHVGLGHDGDEALGRGW